MHAKLTMTSAAAAALLLIASPALAQTTGTSHPEALNDSITTNSASQPQAQTQSQPHAQPAPHYIKPSPAVPMPSNATDDSEPIGLQTRQVSPAYTTPAPYEQPRQTQTARTEQPRFVVTDDPNSGVVTEVATKPNELPAGALLRAQLVGPLSTKTSPVGTLFAASLSQEVLHRGRVILPAGSLIRGHVTAVHSGQRLTGGASIRLQPEDVLLPDGTTFKLAASVIDLDNASNSKVTNEGAIVRNEHPKTTLAIIGATTGAAAIAGAAIGGGVGAAIGAGIGAGAGTIVWLRQDRQETLPAGTKLVFSLDRPLEFEPAPAIASAAQ
jgi:hypothetical protein